MKTIAKTTRNGGQSADVTALNINGLETWLWDAACSIRGAVDAPKFKDYILPLIFMKRLSDVFDDEIERLAAKFGDRDTALELINEDHTLVRFFVPPEASWSEVRKLTSSVGQHLTEIIRRIAKTNPALQGVIDIVDFNATVSGQRIVEDERLKTLIEILSRHRLGLRDVEADILGRAYEYLLRKFAEGQGQTAGEFFTPQEVGWLIARLLRPTEGASIYDPACGSGGLLVKAELVIKELSEKVKRPLKQYGQELNPVTYAIAKMNMIIHDMDGEIAIGDTLRSPKFLSGSKLRTFDLVAANPMWNQGGYDDGFYESDGFDRFRLGYPPASTADWGWVEHMVSSLRENGRAVVVLDTGAVSRGSGGEGSHREREIRRSFVEKDLVEGVIQLPLNLFYNTSSAGILLCLNRNKPANRRGQIVLVNASAEFIKGRPKNFLPPDAIEKIAAAFHGSDDIDAFRKTITTKQAAAADYNLSPSRHVPVGVAGEAESYEESLVLAKQAEDLVESSGKVLRSALSQLAVREGPPTDALPEAWKVVSLRDVVDFDKDALNPLEFPEEHFEYYSIPAYQEAKRPAIEKGSSILSQKIVVKEGIVLFGKLNPRVPKVWLVRSDSDLRKIASTEFIPLSPKPGLIDSEFLYHLCWSDHVLRASQSLVSGSTPSRQRVEARAFLDLKIPLPPIDEQRAIARVLTAIDLRRHANDEHSRALVALGRDLRGAFLSSEVRPTPRKNSS